MVGLDVEVRAHRFGASGRLTHSHSESSFYGTNYYVALPGPGRYETNSSTLHALAPLSRTRVSDWPRRYRNCRPLQGSQATASLSGVDSLLEVPSPAPGSYRDPDSTFKRALVGRNSWNSNFASKTARFPPTRKADDTITRGIGVREPRHFHRTLPPRHKPRDSMGTMSGGGGGAQSAVRPSSVNSYAIEDPRTTDLPLEEPSFLTGEGGEGAVSFQDSGIQFYEREDADFGPDTTTGTPGGPPKLTWVQPRTSAPTIPAAAAPRAKTAAVALKHKAACATFKDDVRAVRRLEGFKLPRTELRV